jgi:hypothetical protein
MFAGLFAGVFGLLVMLFAGAITVGLFVFWIWMLIHAIGNKGLSDTEKIIWVLVIIFLHALGALLYFLLGRPKGEGACG